jgi:hypothetical protein
LKIDDAEAVPPGRHSSREGHIDRLRARDKSAA